MKLPLRKEYFKQLKSLPIKDWHTVAKFHKIILNYFKMDKLKQKDKESNAV